MRTTRIAPVGSVLPSNASAVSSVSRSAMMPEPTTVVTSSAVPSASAADAPVHIVDTGAQPAFGLLPPMSCSRLCKASLSTMSIGRLVKTEMRLFIMR